MTAQADRPAAVRVRRALTEAEQQLWLLERDRPGDPAYVVPFALWVDGPLEVPTLGRALSAVVARHEILRTVVRSVGGSPVLDVVPAPEIPCAVTAVASDGAALAAARAAAAVTFADGEPRLRCHVFRVRPDRSLLMLVLHHAVCDAASLWLILDEVAAIHAGRLADLPEPVQFAELSEPDSARLDRLTGEVADRVRSAPDVVDLPYDRTAATSAEGGVLQLPLPAAVNEATDATARRIGVSPNAVLLAAYGVLLDVVAGADDVLISVPVSRRTTPERRAAIGFLVHSVPVRLRTGEQDTAAELIRHAWSALRQGWTHADVSFGRVVAEVNPQRVAGHNPLCQCEFSVQALPDRLPSLGAATLTYQFVHNGGHKFGLSLEVVATPAGRSIAVEYPVALFDPGTVRRLANLYVRIVSALTAPRAGRLTELDLLSWPERAWLADHGGTPPSTSATPVPDLIEAALLRRPDATAVIAAGSPTSYAELDARSAGIAAALRAAGVAPGQRVAVLGDRATDTVAALVAVIRHRGSFVALADDTPTDRIARVLATARPAAVIVTATRLLDALPAAWRDRGTTTPAGRLLLARAAEPVWPDEAYVVFTSGSTGEPRGVSVPHQAIAVVAQAWNTAFGLTERPGRHLQLAPFSFDVFVGDLVRALCFGGTLVLAERDDVLDPRRLAALIGRAAVDTVEFVPAVARLLHDYVREAGADLPTLRRVMVGSDVWHVADALRLRALLPATARLHCTYGTSESAVDSTLFPVPVDATMDGAVVPIGRPFPGVLVSVRDRLGRPLPPRLPGELWIGGPTVATGYLLSSDGRDRFRTETGPDGAPVRWYRTGDRVVWDADGQLRLLGRVDRQTKIRGVRVDPAEVEAVLRRHPAVADAAVVAVGEARRRVLVAFLTGADVDAATVVAHARRSLLAAAVPAGFHVLERIPTTRHGKVDRAALVAMATSAVTAGGDRTEPAGDLERTVLAVCADVLERDGIGVLDDFYAVGGSSVQLARLAWRVSRATGRHVAVQDVVDAPSVRALCGLITDRADPPEPVAGPRATVVAEPPETAVAAPVPARRVVVTGVTGALGPGIVDALLAGGATEVTCLVRAGGVDRARTRVRTALATAGLDPATADDPRVRYQIADLAQEHIGLSLEDGERIAGADAVVNAAAWVNFVYPYEMLAPVNVAGVAAVARLAGRRRLSPLHHLSTRSVRHPGGYNETKAAAERLVTECRRLGLPVSVYRPGFVLGALSDRPGLLESFLRACVRTGLVPELPGNLNVVTTDHVAARVARNVLSADRIDHLELVGAHPLPWSDAWERLRAEGVPLTEVSVADWLHRQADERDGRFEPFLPLCRSVGLANLLTDDTIPGEVPSGAQSVADAWRVVCAQLVAVA